MNELIPPYNMEITKHLIQIVLSKIFVHLSVFVLVTYGNFSVKSETIYVDNLLSSNCDGNYSIASRDCSGNDGKGFVTIAGAAEAAFAGDTVLIRSGVFSEQVSPKNSGLASDYIVFKNYGNELVTISGASLSPAVWIYEKDYIVIEGLSIINVRRWLNCLGGNHNIIRNNIFRNAMDEGGSSKAGLFFQNSDYNKIINNRIDSSTSDNIGLIQSDNTLIEANTVTRGAHVLWTIKCGNFNVVKNNYFHNEFQKIGEIYDCENVGFGDEAYEKITMLDTTKHNLIEYNVFAYTAPAINESPFAGIQYAGQNGIIRRNVFYNCLGPPIDITLYPDEAKFNYENRIYNNVMYQNGFGGISVPAGAYEGYLCYNNIFKNNILYKNYFRQYDNRWDYYDQLDGKPLQIMIYGSSAILGTSTSIFESNVIFSTLPDELYLIAYGDRTSQANPPPYSISWWETNYPDKFKNNLQVDPLFADTMTRNFRLGPNSTLIDSGRFLAKTKGSGAGSVIMEVNDAGFFTDGFGIEGLSGDTVQLMGQKETANVLSVDYATNTLVLSKPLTWTNGQKLSLKYFGNGPDVGAYEMNLDETGTIETETKSNTINVYPNPSNGMLHIEFIDNTTNDVFIRIFKVTGQMVFFGKCTGFSGNYEESINLSNQTKGVYILRVSTNHVNIIRKIVYN